MQPAEEARIRLGGAVHSSEDKKHDPGGDASQTENQQRVGRADNLDVEAVGVVPPVIEGSGGKHGNASPAGKEDAKGGAEPENIHRRGRELGVVQKRGLDDEPTADDAR